MSTITKYTAIPIVKEGLSQRTIALVDLQDIYKILSLKKELPEYLTSLIREVRLTKKPKPIISIENLPNIIFFKISSFIWLLNNGARTVLNETKILTVSTQISIQQYAF